MRDTETFAFSFLYTAFNGLIQKKRSQGWPSMKKSKVLLFDLDPENSSGADLHQLLEGASDLLEVKHQLIDARELSQAEKHLGAALLRFSPDVTCLIYGAASRAVFVALLVAFRTNKIAQPVVAVVNTAKAEDAAEALVQGANDFVIPPFRVAEVLPRICRWVADARQEYSSIRSLADKMGLKHFVGESPAFLSEIKKIPAMARSAANILIAGETGTGKEICARAIHHFSSRVGKPFVPLNCGAMRFELVENELFGHISGAYTSAVAKSIGLIRAADGGTIFLDEIDSLPFGSQVKLLRFLEEKELRPVGSSESHKADVRIIAAANIDLEKAVETGRFRGDLYYRLNGLAINLPSLRQRNGDVALLSHYFVAKFTTEAGQPSKSLATSALRKLALYHWPGNVRQLKNVIERAVVLSEKRMIEGIEIVLPQTTGSARNVIPSSAQSHCERRG